MIRLVFDPYNTFSPFDKNYWKRIRNTRWTGDDGFRNTDQKEGESRKRLLHRKYSTALTAIHPAESALTAFTTDGKPIKKKRWGSQARTKLTVDDLKQFQERLDVVASMTNMLLFPTIVPEPGNPFLDLEEPPPIYDMKGIRTNTLENRYREKIERDRNILIYQLLQLNPTYTPPSNYKPPVFERILWFPVKQYPDTNFIGAVLGPRGNTQKRLEKETGCKIAIRGKGAEKHIVRRIKNPLTGEVEDMTHHVYLIAPTEEKLDEGIEKIGPLLKPQTELARIEQMKELALINGTYRFDIRCKECGDMGHKDFQCPLNQNSYFANIQCEKCGDVSHATQDCPNKDLFDSNKKETELDYKNFLAEIKGEEPQEIKIENTNSSHNSSSNYQKPKKLLTEEKFNSTVHKTSVTVMKPSGVIALPSANKDSISDQRRSALGQ